VTLACHDLRTPLATVHGFARTLERTGSLGDKEARFVEMITAATQQLAEIIDTLTLIARIEGGRYQPKLESMDVRRLAEGARDRAAADWLAVEGTGDAVDTDVAVTERALADLADAVRRHGGLDQVMLSIAGSELRLSPVSPASGRIAVGEDLRDLGAAAARLAIEALGGSVAVDGKSLVVRLPAPRL
jgi:signal transduction histidine kinase